jgi:hypothetical protein
MLFIQSKELKDHHRIPLEFLVVYLTSFSDDQRNAARKISLLSFRLKHTQKGVS